MEVVGELAVVLFGHDKGRGGSRSSFVPHSIQISNGGEQQTGNGGGRAAKLTALPLNCGPCTWGPTCHPEVPVALVHSLAGFVCVGPRERWSSWKMGLEKGALQVEPIRQGGDALASVRLLTL
jgi:hypothetical protein